MVEEAEKKGARSEQTTVSKWHSLVSVVALVLLVSGCATELQDPQKPNILFILTDDQDTESLAHMPIVQRELVEKGMTFENGILTQPVCCPSRVSMLRGQYPHNHDIGEGTGGSSVRDVRELGLEENTIATWLDDAGYETVLFGKYLNGYEDYRYVPPGWDGWYANVNRDVWAKCLNENGEERCYGGQHPDSVLAEKAEQFVRSSEGHPNPIFLWVSFSAPHDPALYMHRARNEFSRVPLPQPPSFNERDVGDKPTWVRNMPRFTSQQVVDITSTYRDRLRSLQTVDKAVDSLIDTLADTGRLENTYIFFFTDNGYHLGEHRLAAGKGTPYLEATRFPLIIRGPMVPQGQVRQDLVLNTDLAPTFADLGEAQVADFVDGRSLAPLLRGDSSPWRTAALIEHRGSLKLHLPAYTGAFTETKTYVEYENGEKELYDLKTDPYQTVNAYQDADPTLKEELASRLDTLRNCEGEGCRAAEDGSKP